MFLNKRNIINVSISRARDYLFIVMPDDDTENVSNLRLIKRVEGLIQSTDSWNEFLTPDLENIMFGDSKYIENNAFSTSHQSVNVYGLPEKTYEVRTEDAAVDVQIHKVSRNSFETIMPQKPEYSSSVEIISTEKEFVLDKSKVPEDLRDDTLELDVKGVINGECYLVPYDGKLTGYTVKPATGMFIPMMRSGQEKMLAVSVIEEEHIIYIPMFMYKIYENDFFAPEGIELRRALKK